MRTNSSFDVVQKHLKTQQHLEQFPRDEVRTNRSCAAVEEQVVEPLRPPGGGVFRRILVAVDGSAQAGWAVDLVAHLALAHDARLMLLHVVIIPLLRAEFAYVEPTEPGGCFLEAERLLELDKARIAGAIQVDTVQREGDPATEILQTAHSYRADLIIMGTHGRGPIGQVVLGSVANAVMRKSTCPVLTVSHAPVVDSDAPAAATAALY
jgi:nucleotide-binding universal stress UspA family protein